VTVQRTVNPVPDTTQQHEGHPSAARLERALHSWWASCEREHVVTEILRGQQGHPTSDAHEAGPVAETDPGVKLPDAAEWEQAEDAEKTAGEARDRLGQARGADISAADA
jgi:hypothetical protein